MLQVFNKNYDNYMLCVVCCNNINSVYEFSNRCIKNLNSFLVSKEQLISSNSNRYEVLDKTENMVEKTVNYKESIEQDLSTKQVIEEMGQRNITEIEISHSLKNVKSEQHYDIQNFVHLESNNDVLVKIEVTQDVERKPQVKQCKPATDVHIQKDISEKVQGNIKIKIEEDETKCLDYEFIACDDVPGFCELTEGELP